MGGSDLGCLEAESIEIIREAIALAHRPVMLYSIGSGSSVLLHLARKAFWPASLPFPLLHIDTSWNFREAISFRDQIASELGLRLLVFTNQNGIESGVTPFTCDSERYMSLMTGEALRQALDSGGFDIILSEVRRDEANCQTEERVFSLRSPEHRMDPRLQQPELWNLYSGRLRTGETIRVSPLLNWTEEDIWEYIGQEDVPIADLYRAAPRPVVQRSGEWIMVDDNRFPLEVGEIPEIRMVRFRTLGCYPLTAAFESRATTVSEILTEIRKSQGARRHRRLIDYHPQQP